MRTDEVPWWAKVLVTIGVGIALCSYPYALKSCFGVVK